MVLMNTPLCNFGEKMPKNGYRMPKETALKMIEEGTLKLKKGVVPEQKRYIKKERIKRSFFS